MFKRYAPLLGFSLLAAGLWACPGTLEDPASFMVDGGAKPVTGDGAVVAACKAEADIFKAKCISCHSTALKSAGLDLEAAGVFERLKAQKSANTSCGAALIVDTAAVDNSLILKKVSGTHGQCGSKMPLTGDALTTEQIACVKAWITGGGK